MSNTKSKYATKRDSGQQMYGPGCCAHKVTDAQVIAAKRRAEEQRRRDGGDVDPRRWRAIVESFA